jgi:hypothetical protein
VHIHIHVVRRHLVYIRKEGRKLWRKEGVKGVVKEGRYENEGRKDGMKASRNQVMKEGRKEGSYEGGKLWKGKKGRTAYMNERWNEGRKAGRE